MKKIPLTKGKFAIVDDEDFEHLNQFKWYASKSVSGNFYAVRGAVVDGKLCGFLLHRAILSPPTGFEIDHKNRDGLDNRKSNLRIATRQQNMCNKPSQGVIKFKGVSITHAKYGNFRVQIRINGVKTYLGSYKTPEEAALVYDLKAREVHGEFAYLNFPELFL